MRTLASSITTAALAAAATYFFDPVSGRRRRALIRDQVTSIASDASDALGTARRDLANRTHGLAAKTRSRFSRARPDDEVLEERVRSAIGHVVSHPGAIRVDAMSGALYLSGSVLAAEEEELLRTVRSVRGVKLVQNQLRTHETPDGIPELQGEGRREREPGQRGMPPAVRAAHGVLGTGLVVWGLRARSPILSPIAALAGGLCIARGLANRRLRDLMDREGTGIEVHKSLQVDASIDRAFEVLADYTRFPEFMRNVREVRLTGNGRSHWIVAGPAGVPVEWDAETTEYEPNRMIAWRTLPGSTVEHEGRIRLESANGGTRIEVHMSYRPPAGALGHVVARLFGADPKSEMDEDLVRLKTLLERGQAPRDTMQEGEGLRPGVERPAH